MVAVPVFPGSTLPIPPFSLAHGGITLLLLPSCFSTSCIVWSPVYWMNWTPWGAFPWLVILTSTRPPSADFGALKLAVLPCSEMLIFRVLAESLSLPPQPVASSPAVAITPSAARMPFGRTDVISTPAVGEFDMNALLAMRRNANRGPGG